MDLFIRNTHRCPGATQATYHTTEFYTTLSGIDTSTGKIKWTFKPVSESIITGADEVPNFPYLMLRGIPLTIINPSDGRFDHRWPRGASHHSI
ncbi:MAG: hypothetical protein WDO15_11925 [Bacteroidota bacterium]